MSTGEVLRVRAAMKPLSTLVKALDTVDMATGARAKAVVQRSDVTAVPAAGVVAEAVVALVLADALLEKTGGDSLAEVRRNLDAYLTGLDPQADEGRAGRRRGRGPGGWARPRRILARSRSDRHSRTRRASRARVSRASTVTATPRLTTASCPNRARKPPSCRGHRLKATGGRAGEEDEQQEPAHLTSLRRPS